MTGVILGYLFLASCMFAAAYSISNEVNWVGLLLVSLFWPWFLFGHLPKRKLYFLVIPSPRQAHSQEVISV